MDNGKKEYAENGDECDYLSSKSRKVHSQKYGKAKKIKKQVNKRFRKRNKIDRNENIHRHIAI